MLVMSEVSKRISDADATLCPNLRPVRTIVSAQEGKHEWAVKRDKEARKANKEEAGMGIIMWKSTRERGRDRERERDKGGPEWDIVLVEDGKDER